MNRIILTILACCMLAGCDEPQQQKSSDEKQKEQQEVLLKEGTAQVGMPNIKNFRERKQLHDIYELRDQADYTTYTYTYSEMTGKKTFFCNSIGYGIPYATQFTSPQKVQQYNNYQRYDNLVVPQADPNGLFSPPSAEGTWVMCKDPKGTDVKPVYVEPRIIVSPFAIDDETPTKELPAKK
jgi:hypothetical protein